MSQGGFVQPPAAALTRTAPPARTPYAASQSLGAGSPAARFLKASCGRLAELRRGLASLALKSPRTPRRAGPSWTMATTCGRTGVSRLWGSLAFLAFLWPACATHEQTAVLQMGSRNLKCPRSELSSEL